MANSYEDAFYTIAKILGIGAMPISPCDAFESVLKPRIEKLVNNSATMIDVLQSAPDARKMGVSQFFVAYAEFHAKARAALSAAGDAP